MSSGEATMSRGDSDQLGAREEFSTWLLQQMANQKLSGAELARMVQSHLPEGVHFTPSNISHYRAGRSIPRALIREVIEKIVSGEAARKSQPNGQIENQDQKESSISIGEKIQLEDLGSGRVRILIDQQLPWAEALELIKRLKLDPISH